MKTKLIKENTEQFEHKKIIEYKHGLYVNNLYWEKYECANNFYNSY